VHALQDPQRRAVLPPQTDLGSANASFAADALYERVPFLGTEVEVAGIELEELFARAVAEHAGHGIVALENPARDRVPINAGQVALEEKAMPLLALAERGVRAPALQGGDEDLPGASSGPRDRCDRGEW
jgi:hypothetical protein